MKSRRNRSSQSLLVKFYHRGKKIAEADSITMEPLSKTIQRKFHFHQMKFINFDGIGESEKIEVRILFRDTWNGHNTLVPRYSFRILLREFGEPNSDWWFTGCVINETEYDQGVVDVFLRWSEGVEFDLDYFIESGIDKPNYFTACRWYFGINTNPLEKAAFELDLSKINNFDDFIFLMSVEFFGDRSYMGHSVPSFEDCLWQWSENNPNQEKKIVFKNSGLMKKELQNDMTEVFQVFKKYDFEVDLI